MDFQKELTTEFENESASTRKMLDAIPDDADFGWAPHEKSMKLGKLAGHVADTLGSWATHTLTQDQMVWNPEMKGADPATKAELMAQFDKQLAESKAALATMTPERWETHWKFVAGDQTWIDDTKYRVWRTWVINHMVHHRAQLGVYLRLLNKKVPGCYGPSADEM